MRIYIDHTHLWRHVTGLERVTLEQFSPQALAPLDAVPINANRMSEMLLTQTFGLPARLVGSSSSLLLCPGFPPTPLLHMFRGRVIPYIHDLFLLTRLSDLNWRAKLYSAWPFSLAVRRLSRFLVNSVDTAVKLAQFCREDAEITIYRPAIRNNFGLTVGARAVRPPRPAELRLVALGTVEPRKNLRAAAAIVSALRQRGFGKATLEIVGRRGWGDNWDALAAIPGVTLHGYQPDHKAAAILDRADALLCTSHEEGLGLPLLEAQYAGLPIIAPDQPVFREVLGHSGVYIDPGNPRAAAEAISALIESEEWRLGAIDRAAQNLQRWNDLAASDRDRIVELLSQIGRSKNDTTNSDRTVG